jgi:Histidine kinase-, DNA gyrase B-, and HSP90-like ATPase
MMEDLSLHILDIVENSLAANARTISVRVEERRSRDRLVLEIVDDGQGMEAKRRARALDPFFTTKTTRSVGLGLPFLAQAAETAGGKLVLSSEPGRGTKVRATFRLGHIDLQPLGDIAETLAVLIAAHPETDFRYTHVTDDGRYAFRSRDVRSRPGDKAPSRPRSLSGMKEEIRSGLARLRRRP